MNDRQRQELMADLDRLHTTKLGEERIKRNLHLDVDDVVGWCAEKIREPRSEIARKGKNWKIIAAHNEITVNASSCTIITAHKIK